MNLRNTRGDSNTEEVSVHKLDEIAEEYIVCAESLFGEMCSEWIYSGVEINNQPPHLRYYPESEQVTISLSERVLEDNTQLHFQLAHEACHLLYPTKSLYSTEQELTTVLNEGVSTYFSILAIEKMCEINPVIDDLKDRNFNYYKALLLVYKLLKLDPESIKKLRSIQPKLNSIKLNDFSKANLQASDSLAKNLLTVFK